MLKRVLPLILMMIFLPLPVQSQSAGVYVDIGPCMAMTDDTSRYACYDLLEEQIRASQAREVELPVMSIQRNTRQQPAQVQEPVIDQDQEQVSSVGDFGRETAATASNREANARILENDDGQQELVDTIVSLDERMPNQWQITLAGGQVWNQMNSKRYRLQEGMEVRVYPSPFGGSFRLSATGLNGFIQVRRIQ